MSSTIELSLEPKLAFLRQPSSYPEPTYRVEAIETHMSWVFLTDAFAYKLKKPVCHGALDFRKVESRRFYCEEEIRLNRRLAPGVYLGVVPLSLDPHGHLHLRSNSHVTDWLVRMHRLPSERMLDYLIRKGQADPADMRKIAMVLAAFYRQASVPDVQASEYRMRMEHEIDFNFATLTLPAYALPVERIRRVCAMQQHFLEEGLDRLEARVCAGRIVEGHGDLRPEHVCLGTELAIIDCLEFSRALRTVDAAEEIAFLALECERLEAPQLGNALLDAYMSASGDTPEKSLVHFYQSFRAGSRARIAIQHLDEEKFRHSPEWRRRAMDYLRLAEEHAGNL
ncbi:MAG TPA: hypothetical protein VGE12_00675 [Noviherbaspirillum sp.]